MNLENVPIGTLREDPSNLAVHPPAQVERARSILARFGQRRPLIIDVDGVVRCGNLFFRVMKELGFERVVVDRVTDLSGADLVALAIADNRASEGRGWEDGPLLATLTSFDEDLRRSTGFSDADVEELRKRIDATPPKEFVSFEATGDAEHRCPSCGHEWNGRCRL